MNKKNRWNIWFWSDPHFGHANAIKFGNRPFTDAKDMEEKLIRNYNRKVQPNDLCIWVGDCFFYYTDDELRELMGKLNGRKVLVRGNHDKKAKQLMNVGFDFVCEEMDYYIAKERVTISHYPFKPSILRQLKWHLFLRWWLKIKGVKTYKLNYIERRPVNRGQFLIHGHTHSEERVQRRMIHVGVDAWDYEPVSLNKISDIIADVKRKERK